MNNNLYQLLLSEIQKAFTKKSTMVNTLAEILRIEKGAVYRRLRQEVPFTFNEIAIIANYLKMSLDSMIGVDFLKSILFQLRLLDFIYPKEIDFHMLDLYTEFLQSINQSKNAEVASATNILPLDLFEEFHSLYKFYFFMWNFHYHDDTAKPFHQIVISPRINRFLHEYIIEMKKFNKISYVFDSRVFEIFVNNVKYFHSIKLIEKEEMIEIKKDLYAMLDSLEDMAISGQFRETGKTVNIYISDIDITTNYTYMESEHLKLSLIKTFILSSVTSLDVVTFEKMKRWVHSMIKISTLITLTNEKQRVMYFEKQRETIDEL